MSKEKLKFVLVGDKYVGKRTMLCTAFDTTPRLSPLYIPIEFVEVEVKGKNKNWKVMCYDSLVNRMIVPKSDAALIEGFNAQAVIGADAVLFCYASDNPDSFRNLNSWYKNVGVFLTPNSLIYLVETKGDLGNKVTETEITALTNDIKFENHFKVHSLEKESVLYMFENIVNKVESIINFNQSQSLERNSIKFMTSESPEKRKTAGSQQDIRFSDKKEKIILQEGSYIKRLGVTDNIKIMRESSSKIQSKKLLEEDGFDFKNNLNSVETKEPSSHDMA